MAWLLIALMLFPAFAGAQPNAAELLREVKATYGGATRFRFSAHLVERRSGVETTGADEIAVSGQKLWFKAEGTSALQFSGGIDAGTLVVVANGGRIWVYAKKQNRYTEAEGPPDHRNADSEDDSVDNPRSFARKIMDSLFLRYAKFESLSQGARVAREEACGANDSSMCYVVDIKQETLQPSVPGGVYTLWVETGRHLVLRDDFTAGAYTNSIRYDVAEVGVDVPEQFFTWVLPNGAKRVSSFFY